MFWIFKNRQLLEWFCIFGKTKPRCLRPREKYFLSNTATFKNCLEDNLRTIFWGYSCPPLSSNIYCSRLSEQCICSFVNVFKAIIQSRAQILGQNGDLVLHRPPLSSHSYNSMLTLATFWAQWKGCPKLGHFLGQNPDCVLLSSIVLQCPLTLVLTPTSTRLTLANYAHWKGSPNLGHSFWGKTGHCPPYVLHCPLTPKCSDLALVPAKPYTGNIVHPL